MPTLNDIHCSVKLSDDTALKEYGVKYHNGGVTAYIAVPGTNQAFHLHIFSTAWIAPGLAVFVYIDGKYQANRNRVDLLFPRPGVPLESHQIDFRFRQKENKSKSGTFVGREWTFATLNSSAAGKATSKVEDSSHNVGRIEVVVLRCQPAFLVQEAQIASDFPPSKAKDNKEARRAARDASATGSVLGDLAGLFDGAGDEDTFETMFTRMTSDDCPLPTMVITSDVLNAARTKNGAAEACHAWGMDGNDDERFWRARAPSPQNTDKVKYSRPRPKPFHANGFKFPPGIPYAAARPRENSAGSDVTYRPQLARDGFPGGYYGRGFDRVAAHPPVGYAPEPNAHLSPWHPERYAMERDILGQGHAAVPPNFQYDAANLHMPSYAQAGYSYPYPPPAPRPAHAVPSASSVSVNLGRSGNIHTYDPARKIDFQAEQARFVQRPKYDLVRFANHVEIYLNMIHERSMQYRDIIQVSLPGVDVEEIVKLSGIADTILDRVGEMYAHLKQTVDGGARHAAVGLAPGLPPAIYKMLNMPVPEEAFKDAAVFDEVLGHPPVGSIKPNGDWAAGSAKKSDHSAVEWAKKSVADNWDTDKASDRGANVKSAGSWGVVDNSKPDDTWGNDNQGKAADSWGKNPDTKANDSWGKNGDNNANAAQGDWGATSGDKNDDNWNQDNDNWNQDNNNWNQETKAGSGFSPDKNDNTGWGSASTHSKQSITSGFHASASAAAANATNSASFEIPSYFADWRDKSVNSLSFSRSPRPLPARRAFVYPSVPAGHVSASKIGDRTHAVQPGEGAEYTHLTRQPHYIDDMEKPYAVFRFEYRSVDGLKKILNTDNIEDPSRARPKAVPQKITRARIVKNITNSARINTEGVTRQRVPRANRAGRANQTEYPGLRNVSTPVNRYREWYDSRISPWRPSPVEGFRVGSGELDPDWHPSPLSRGDDFAGSAIDDEQVEAVEINTASWTPARATNAMHNVTFPPDLSQREGARRW